MRRFRILFGILLSALSAFSVTAQSTNPSFPTPVTTNEISGTIKARDLGDSRLTNYYYAFNANQGDVFINVVTKNLTGDIDVFTAGNLRPLTKIVVYADSSQNETGRVVYLRKPERLILRVEGKTPNDDPATFTIKFAGSFVPLTVIAESEEPKLPEINRQNQGDVIVNSVGTIIGVKPKPTPSPKEIAAEKETSKTIQSAETNPEVVSQTIPTEKAEETAQKEISEVKENTAKTAPVVVITENLPPQPTEISEPKETISAKNEEISTDVPVVKPVEKETTPAAEKNVRTEKKVTELSPEMKKLESIRLSILMKNGTRFERPMSEIFSVNVDRGQLTVITKEGKIERFSIFDVSKMTIE